MVNSQFATHTELFDLSGKRGLVTGGTRGIGMMIARGLLQAGGRLVISSRNAEACAQAQEQLSKFGEVRAIPADLSRYDECQRLADLVKADSERLDILVNNAGAMWREPLETFPAEAWDAVLDLNLKSPFWLVQALLPALRRAAPPMIPRGSSTSAVSPRSTSPRRPTTRTPAAKRHSINSPGCLPGNWAHSTSR